MTLRSVLWLFPRGLAAGLCLLATLSLSAALKVLPPGEEQEQLATILPTPDQHRVHCLAFSPDGKTLAAGGGMFPGHEGWVSLWDVPTRTARAIAGGHRNLVYMAAFAPDGDTLATMSFDGVVKLRDVATGCERTSLTIFPECSSLPMAFSPASQVLAQAGYELGVVRLWRLPPDSERALAAGSSPFVFAADGRGLTLWRIAPAAELAGNRQDIQRLTPYAELGHRLAVDICDVTNGQQAFTLYGHTNRVAALAFSPDGRMVASGSYDHTIKLWDVATGRERVTLRGHTDQVNAVVFAADGKRLASASHDRTLRVWDSATGYEQAILRGHAGAVTCVACDPGDQWIASGSYDNTVRLWPLEHIP